MSATEGRTGGAVVFPGPAGLATRASLVADLLAVGVRPGSVLLVHSAMSKLGWVCGGAVTVVQALMEALGPKGTLLVATHTASNSDPAQWTDPAVPEEWWPVIEAELPGFHPRITPSHRMGVVSETARSWPAARRSDHPRVSYAAIGPKAEGVDRQAPAVADVG